MPTRFELPGRVLLNWPYCISSYLGVRLHLKEVHSNDRYSVKRNSTDMEKSTYFGTGKVETAFGISVLWSGYCNCQRTVGSCTGGACNKQFPCQHCQLYCLAAKCRSTERPHPEEG